MELDCYHCPNKTRYYEIEAIQIPIVYNRYGDHDPDGLLFVPLEEAAIVAPGTRRFRECVVFVQNGIRMLDKDDELVKTTVAEEGEEVDPQGHRRKRL